MSAGSLRNNLTSKKECHKNKIKISIVDDHELIRVGVARLISRHKDMELVGEGSNAEDAMRLATEKNPDVLVLDIRMEKSEEMVRPSGLRAILELKEKCPPLKIIIHTMYERADYANDAIRFGASGYVLKTGRGADLITAIRVAYKGDYYFSPEINKMILSRHKGLEKQDSPADISSYDRLTEREQYILRRIVNGASTREISDELGIAVRTVGAHRYRLGQKLGIKNRVELIKFATRIGIIDPEDWVE